MGPIQEKNFKLYLSFLIMETYYSKKEYNDMKKTLEKRIQLLEKQNAKLVEKNHKLTEAYELITK